jgi:hypothetical protein
MRWFQIARSSVILTLTIGAYLHLNNIIFGTDLLIEHLFTPFFDLLFAVPMLIGGIAVLASWKQIRFRNKFEKGIVVWTAFYFLASLPLHIQSWLTQSTDYIRFFPIWYSGVFLAYTAVMQWVWWHLEAKAETKAARALA